MTVYWVISLPKTPYIHRINMVLAKPMHIVSGSCCLVLLGCQYYLVLLSGNIYYLAVILW